MTYILVNFDKDNYKVRFKLPREYFHVKVFDEITQREVVIWGDGRNRLFNGLRLFFDRSVGDLNGLHFIKVEEERISTAYRPNLSVLDSNGVEQYKFKSFGLPKKDKHLKDEYVEYFI